MRGRPPVPTNIKRLMGNPGHRPLNHHEPQLPIEAPECPDWLDDVGRKYWDLYVPILLKLRVLTEADGLSLATLCMTISMMTMAHREIKNRGAFLVDGRGNVQANPALRIVHRCQKDLGPMMNQLGLTPSARALLRVPSQNDPDRQAANRWAELAAEPYNKDGSE